MKFKFMIIPYTYNSNYVTPKENYKKKKYIFMCLESQIPYGIRIIFEIDCIDN